jgi:hypothetical protein
MEAIVINVKVVQEIIFYNLQKTNVIKYVHQNIIKI